MQTPKQPSRDFDVWASAVRQQMLDSLTKRRTTLQTDAEPCITVHQIRESDNG